MNVCMRRFQVPALHRQKVAIEKMRKHHLKPKYCRTWPAIGATQSDELESIALMKVSERVMLIPFSRAKFHKLDFVRENS